jgi:hypothetical protein
MAVELCGRKSEPGAADPNFYVGRRTDRVVKK